MNSRTYIQELFDRLCGNLSREVLSKDEIESIVNDLEKIGKPIALIELFNSYDTTFNIPFMLCLPEVWTNFNLADWNKILLQTSRPADFRYLMKDYGNFDDIVFLYRYVEVDSILWVFNHKDLSKEDKQTILEFFKMGSHLLERNFLDEENIQDGTWADRQTLLTMKERLLHEGFPPLNKKEDQDALRERISSYLEKIVV